LHGCRNFGTDNKGLGKLPHFRPCPSKVRNSAQDFGFAVMIVEIGYDYLLRRKTKVISAQLSTEGWSNSTRPGNGGAGDTASLPNLEELRKF